MKAVTESSNRHLAILSLVLVAVIAFVQDWTRSQGIIISGDLISWTILYSALIILTYAFLKATNNSNVDYRFLDWLASINYLFIGLLMLAFFSAQVLWTSGLYGMTVYIILGVLLTTSGISLLTLLVNYLTAHR